MKKSILICFVLIITTKFAISQHTLVIEVSDIRNNTGNIMLQLFDQNEKVLNQEMSEIKDNKCSFSIKDLKTGKYAVRYFHDENLNGNMDANSLGMPTEGYGFSNNATGMIGPPKFEDWIFEITGDKKIVLKPKY